MMLYSPSILAFPMVLTGWACDAYLFAAALRLCGHWLAPHSEFTGRVAQVTDPIPATLQALIARWWQKACPHGVSWLLVVVGLVVLRHVLLALAMVLS